MQQLMTEEGPLNDQLLAIKAAATTLDGAAVKTAASGATRLSQLLQFSAALTPAQVAANTSAEQAFAVAGVAVGDLLASAIKPSATAGIGIVNARVSGVNQVSITFMNNTAGAITPPAETYAFVIARP